MKRLNIAIVGCGWAAGWHATDLAMIPELFSLVACCDPIEQRRREFGDLHRIPLRVGELAEVLAMPEVDIVVLCTPPGLHHPMVLQSLAAGKHVVCEKPFTSSLALADSIRDAATRSAGRVMPVFQYRFGNGLAKIRHAIQSGLVGKHHVSTIETARTRGPEYYRTAWRGKFATELGGVLVTQAIHIHDLVYWLLGPAAAVTGFKTTRVNPIEVEDCAVASLFMADGSLVSLSATLGAVREATCMRLCFENVTFERNSAHDSSRPADDPWIVQPRTAAVGDAIERKMREIVPGRSWFARQYELLHEALMAGGPLPVTINDARASLELITALYHAGETGTTVRLPIESDHPRYAGWISEPSRHPSRP